MSEPMYSCAGKSEFGCCADDCSYPASMLKDYMGGPYCSGCWSEMPTLYRDANDEDAIRWDELDNFIPAHESTITQLQSDLKASQSDCNRVERERDVLMELIYKFSALESLIPPTKGDEK